MTAAAAAAASRGLLQARKSGLSVSIASARDERIARTRCGIVPATCAKITPFVQRHLVDDWSFVRCVKRCWRLELISVRTLYGKK